MKLKSVEIEGLFGYRDRVKVSLDSNAIAIIGKNNSGKSHLLSSIRFAIQNANVNGKTGLPDLMAYEGSDAKDEVNLALIFSVERSALIERASSRKSLNQISDALSRDNGEVLFISTIRGDARSKELSIITECVSGISRDGLADPNKILEACADAACSHIQRRALYLPSWRNHAAKVTDAESLHKGLLRLSNPKKADRHLGPIFARIQSLFETLSGLRGAQLVPAGEESEILIRKSSGHMLPLRSLGDGIVHCLALAYELAYDGNRIFLIEEPELGVHPTLQRVFARFVNKERQQGQVIFSTHSSVFLNERNLDAVVRVSLVGGRSVANECSGYTDARTVLDDLGQRASDVLQANVCVWVEGPTDRLLVRHWLDLHQPSLKEGVDYQFVLYGGALVSYLAFGEGESDDLMNALRLSRNAVVIVDRDRATQAEPLKARAERVLREVAEAGGIGWCTSGREIENYIPLECINGTLKALGVRCELDNFGEGDRLSDRMAALEVEDGQIWIRKYLDNKVRMIQKVLTTIEERHLNVLDLKSRIEELAEYIVACNAEG